MQRLRINPRPDWQRAVESKGFLFHSVEGQPYWDETACYQFTSGEIDQIEKASYALNEMCLAAVEHVFDQDLLLDPFYIPERYHDWVGASWERDEITIYGRFDLAFDGRGGPPKLLEYNADTPTSLLEAAVVQWFWLKDVYPQADQFNSIHERLIEAWRRVLADSAEDVYFTCVRGHLEDYMTVSYLRDTAMQAGCNTQYIDIETIGWNRDRNRFVDERERPINQCFKLYPWEWMLRERFGPNLVLETTRWLEAPWKMILSNKAILAVLWELFPKSPYLLPASMQPIEGDYVRKPFFGREGANVQLVVGGQETLQTEGEYGEPFVYQRYVPLPSFEGNCPVIGSWMVNGYACGMGIREDRSPVTCNTSRFVPHLFTK